MNYEIVNAFREYARDTARWWENYQKQCSPLTNIPRNELAEKLMEGETDET